DTLYVSPATQSIFKSIDGGDSFTILPKTVNVDLAIDPFNADHVFNGAVHSLDGGFNWVESITPLEGFNIKTASTTFDTVQPNVVVASVIQIKSNSEEKYQVQRSTDGGASWNITLELDTPPGKPVAVPGQSGHFYLPVPAYGLSKPTDGLFKSTDGGISWTSVLNIGATTVAVSAAAPERVVALTFNGLQISYNGGASWQFLTIAPGPTTPEQLLLDPYTATTVLVATSFGLYRYDFSNSDCTSRIHYDQNCDGKADILWRHQQTGLNWFYAMDGSNIIESRAINTVDLSWETAGRGDFNDDGLSDLLWINKDTGLVYLYYMEGGKFISGKPVTTIAPDSGWQVAAISDFNGDDKADILWRNNNDGRLWLYQMDGHSISASQHVTTITDLNWTVIDAPDLNGDGKADLLLRHATTGLVWRYLMDGAIITSSQKLISVGLEWQLVISGDFDGDKDADILWRNTQDGRNYVYLLDNGLINWAQRGFISQFADQQWQAILAGDFDGDGDDDIFWRHLGSGNNYLYLMDGLSFTGKALPPVNDMNWKAIK
ncbi:MAG: hypothetical protein CMF25_02855, partial [Kangiellaceae bacterium]|nr:hypothetical protein [Kangiellaceae bacterium]